MNEEEPHFQKKRKWREEPVEKKIFVDACLFLKV